MRRAVFWLQTQFQAVGALNILDRMLEEGELEEVIFMVPSYHARSGMREMTAGLEKLARQLRAQIFIVSRKPIKPKLKNWIRSSECRNTFGLWESLCASLSRRARKEALHRVFHELLPERFFDSGTVFCFHSLGDETEALASRFLDNGAQVFSFDEGTMSYTVWHYGSLPLSGLFLYQPELFTAEAPGVPIRRLSPLTQDRIRLKRWLQTVFEPCRARDADVLWIGQAYANSRYRSALAGVQEAFVEKMERERQFFVCRPHPGYPDLVLPVSKFGTVEHAGIIPLEVELFLGYRQPPREIHTICSSGAFYLHLLMPDLASRTVSFYSLPSFERRAGFPAGTVHENMMEFLKRLEARFPGRIVEETL